MIHIEKDQEIAGQKELRVSSPSGDYEDSSLIEFYHVDNASVVSGAFQAQYVKYGGLVYNYSDHATLGDAILLLDPESTHTAASYVRMNRELLAKMDEGTLEVTSLQETLDAEQTTMESKMDNSVQPAILEEKPTESAPTPDVTTEDSTAPIDVPPQTTGTVEIVPDSIIPETSPNTVEQVLQPLEPSETDSQNVTVRTLFGKRKIA